jgi:Zn-dependent alcohol dehydrogenase
VGSYYGSADPALSMARLVELANAGRLPLDDMISHRIELDQVPEALERLRRGEGDRSVVVLDSRLAGATASGADPTPDHRMEERP